MRPLMRIAALMLAAATTMAPAARAQGPAPGDDGTDDLETIELADMGPGLHAGLDGFGPGPGGRGFAARRGGGRDGMRGGHGFGGRGMGPRLEAIRELGLTDAQRQRLADIREQDLKTAIPIEADLRLARLELGKLARADKVDAPAVDRQIDRISALQASLMKSRWSGMLEARSVLTPVQQKKLRDLRREGRPREEAKRSG